MRDLKKLFCEYAKNIIICPSAQTDPSFSAILSLLFQNIACIIPPNLCLSPAAIYTPKFESDLVRNSEERPSRDVVCHMKKWVKQSPRKF